MRLMVQKERQSCSPDLQPGHGISIWYKDPQISFKQACLGAESALMWKCRVPQDAYHSGT